MRMGGREGERMSNDCWIGRIKTHTIRGKKCKHIAQNNTPIARGEVV